MHEIFLDYVRYAIEPFFDPQKRVFLGYLASAFIVAILVQIYILKKSLRFAVLNVFSWRIWASRSARADYKVMILNQAFMLGVAPQLLSKLAFTTILFEALHIWFDGRVILWSSAPTWCIAIIFTLTLFVVDDFAKYYIHRLLHRVPILWYFHKVHHTAETLTPLTVYRTHPIEALIFGMRSVAVQSTIIASFLYFFGDKVELITLLGSSAILFLFNLVGSNLRHSHIWLSYGRLVEKIFISPAQHQIHHSILPKHFDRNYGTILAVWDLLFGTLWTTTKHEPGLLFGIRNKENTMHNLISLYIEPFICAMNYLKTELRQMFNKSLTGNYVDMLKRLSFLLLFLLSLITVSSTALANELNIYSHRQPFLIKPFIDAYESETGTKVNVVYASKGLAQRLQSEGSRSPADLVLTVDIARLHVYSDKDLLAPVNSSILTRNVPEHLRDPNNTWFAFSKRARVIVVAKEKDDTSKIKTYEQLADDEWKGRICLRPGSHVYNRALLSSMISAVGADAAEVWANGLVKNLARRPQGNDRAQVKAIYEGVCDISIINNYYFGKLKYSENQYQREWAESVRLIFPNQKNRGTHINISGGGIAKFSKNKKEATKFLEFLVSEKAQKLYGDINFEYPVRLGMHPPTELLSWGEFQEDRLSIKKIAELAPQAQKIIDRVGW